jgi:hypothetical protein
MAEDFLMQFRGPFQRNASGTIDCEVLIGNEWHPFTADPDDVEEHGRAIFAIIEAEHADEIQEEEA